VDIHCPDNMQNSLLLLAAAGSNATIFNALLQHPQTDISLKNKVDWNKKSPWLQRANARRN